MLIAFMVQDQEVFAAEVMIVIIFLYFFLSYLSVTYVHFVILLFLIAECFCPNQMERTFIAIKPDGVQRGLVIFFFFF